MEATRKRVIVVGKGISGLGAKEALEKLGVECVLCNDADFDDKFTRNFDAMIVSPAVKKNSHAVVSAKKLGLPVLGELELGSILCKKPIIAVTGTNGKTTVVRLIGEMLKNRNACVCGNIGVSFSKCATENHDCFVVETSSFQLEQTATFAPKIAVITNLAVDHLDRHESMENYAKTKLRIAENQTKTDYLLLSADDISVEYLRGFSPKSKTLFVSTKSRVNGAYLHNKKLYLMDEYLCNEREVRAQGEHNIKNALFASLSAWLYGVALEEIKNALSSVKPDAHRIEYVTSIRGVAFYDDSKGTNLSATRCAMYAMPYEFCLIAGGSDKGYEYDELFVSAPKTLKKVCAIGETAQKIVDAGRRNGFTKVIKCSNMCEAVTEGYKSGADAVLLSPASASFDAYSSYRERGKDFVRIVLEIKDIEKRQ